MVTLKEEVVKEIPNGFFGKLWERSSEEFLQECFEEYVECIHKPILEGIVEEFHKEMLEEIPAIIRGRIRSNPGRMQC